MVGPYMSVMATILYSKPGFTSSTKSLTSAILVSTGNISSFSTFSAIFDRIYLCSVKKGFNAANNIDFKFSTANGFANQKLLSNLENSEELH